MIKHILAAGAIVASVSFAYAGDIPATPMNHGPLVVSGMGVAGEIANIGLTPVNIVSQPILAPGVAAGAPAEAPVVKHRHRRHLAHRAMHRL